VRAGAPAPPCARQSPGLGRLLACAHLLSHESGSTSWTSAAAGPPRC